MHLRLITLVTLIITLASLAHTLDHPAHQLEERDAGDDGEWIDLSVGVLMKRDEDDHSSPSLERRASATPPVSTPISLRRDPTSGSWKWPRNFAEAQSMISKRNLLDLPGRITNSLARRSNTMRVIITWYTGHDLLNPACFPDSANWAPTDKSMAAAVTIDWPGKPKCGSFVKIQHATNPDKKIIVRIVDSCGGCAAGSPHIDLTIGAFKKLYDLDVGIMDNLKAKVIKCPFAEDKWPQYLNRYGPPEVIRDESDSYN